MKTVLPIRVLQLFTVLDRGGAETNVMNYYRHLDRSRFQFDFVVHRETEGAYEAEILALGGRIFRFNPVHPLHLAAYQKQLTAFFDLHTYSIIHGQCSELGYFFYKEAHRRGVPVIIAHGHNSKAAFDLKFPFRWFWKKRMLRYLTAYFSCGQEASVWLFGSALASKAFIMTNAVDSRQFAYNSAVAATVKNELQCAATKNIIHVGRFCSQKNHGFLLSVFHELYQLDSSYRLFLVGDGELRPALEQRVSQLGLQGAVHFLGLRSDVNRLLQAMDVFLFPSLFEGLPVSLVEAQASGIACFISDGVPAEAVLLPDHVTVLSLRSSAASWAAAIYAHGISPKADVVERIVDAGYDIQANVIQLEQHYLTLLTTLSCPR